MQEPLSFDAPIQDARPRNINSGGSGAGAGPEPSKPPRNNTPQQAARAGAGRGAAGKGPTATRHAPARAPRSGPRTGLRGPGRGPLRGLTRTRNKIPGQKQTQPGTGQPGNQNDGNQDSGRTEAGRRREAQPADPDSGATIPDNDGGARPARLRATESARPETDYGTETRTGRRGVAAEARERRRH